MLSSNYYSNINIADRKSTGQSFRTWLVQDLINTYDQPDHNIVERSRMLFDAARLIGMHNKKPKNDWKFTAINSIDLNASLAANTDLETQQLKENTTNTIKKLQEDVFLNFNDFQVFWQKKEFLTTQEYLDAFYRYIPYVKLGVDEEKEVRNIVNPDKNILKLALARQKAVIRRVTDVFFSNKPKDIPELITESLIDFSVRFEEESIPLKTLP